jgi:biotin carboxyl carrier protein
MVRRSRHEVEIDGRVRQVVVEGRDTPFTVAIDDRTRHVDAARAGDNVLSLLVDGASYEVVVRPAAAAGTFEVQIDGLPMKVALNGPRRSQPLASERHAGDGPQRIVAPMPGKVVRVVVAPGDAVRARQILVVVEAMKMENELRASRDGIVAELPAREGASVDAGALLAVVE